MASACSPQSRDSREAISSKPQRAVPQWDKQTISLRGASERAILGVSKGGARYTHVHKPSVEGATIMATCFIHRAHPQTTELHSIAGHILTYYVQVSLPAVLRAVRMA